MNIVCLQHVPFEGPAAIGVWAKERGHNLTSIHLYKNEMPPGIADLDMLAVMGGPMSIHDEAEFPWLRMEKEFIRRTIDAGRIVLGACLGAQHIAHALGARVFPNAQKEIGWFPVELTAQGKKSPLFDRFPQTFPSFHWHGETFDIPDGATHLARTPACENQAFSLGERTLALQFHIESTPESVAALTRNCPGDLAPGAWVQQEEEIGGMDRKRIAEMNGRLFGLLDVLVGGKT